MAHTAAKRLAAILAAACWAIPGWAQTYRDCKFSPAVAEVQSLADLPETIRAHLLSVADKGAPFNHSDVVVMGKDAPPNEGLLRAGHLGPRWFVWIGIGGIALFMQTRIYDESGKQLAAWRDANDPCTRTEAALR